MTPSPLAARRLLPLGCGLLATLALLLPGCGEEGEAAPESTTARQQARETDKGAGRPAPAKPAAGACPRQVDSFVGSLQRLRRRLAIGLSYEQYVARVKALRTAYDAIPVDRLALDCLAATGTPSERALNQHIDAVNAWGECLADAACTTATIEPVLQGKWRVASRFLSAARASVAPGSTRGG